MSSLMLPFLAYVDGFPLLPTASNRRPPPPSTLGGVRTRGTFALLPWNRSFTKFSYLSGERLYLSSIGATEPDASTFVFLTSQSFPPSFLGPWRGLPLCFFVQARSP